MASGVRSCENHWRAFQAKSRVRASEAKSRMGIRRKRGSPLLLEILEGIGWRVENPRSFIPAKVLLSPFPGIRALRLPVIRSWYGPRPSYPMRTPKDEGWWWLVPWCNFSYEKHCHPVKLLSAFALKQGAHLALSNAWLPSCLDLTRLLLLWRCSVVLLSPTRLLEVETGVSLVLSCF